MEKFCPRINLNVLSDGKKRGPSWSCMESILHHWIALWWWYNRGRGGCPRGEVTGNPKDSQGRLGYLRDHLGRLGESPSPPPLRILLYNNHGGTAEDHQFYAIDHYSLEVQHDTGPQKERLGFKRHPFLRGDVCETSGGGHLVVSSMVIWLPLFCITSIGECFKMSSRFRRFLPWMQLNFRSRKPETHNMGWTYDSKLTGSKMIPQQEKISYIHIHRSHGLFKNNDNRKNIWYYDIIDTPHHAFPPLPGTFWTSRLEDGPGAIAWVHQGREESPERLKESFWGKNQGTWF